VSTRRFSRWETEGAAYNVSTRRFSRWRREFRDSYRFLALPRQAAGFRMKVVAVPDFPEAQRKELA
jgi:hypothetical protein